jgi:hypothetical protein
MSALAAIAIEPLRARGQPHPLPYTHDLIDYIAAPLDKVETHLSRKEIAGLGIDHATLSELDSIKLTNTVSRFIRPVSTRLSHEVSPLESGRYICGLDVMAADSSY